MRRIAFALALSLMLGACANPADGTVYDVPLQTAFSRLIRADLSGGLGNDSVGLTSLELNRGYVPPDHVTWRLWRENEETHRFDIRLKPEGDDRTRVVIEYQPMYRGGQWGSPSNAMGVAAEQVAAILEERPYSSQRAGNAGSAVLMADPAGTAKGIADDKARAAEAIKGLTIPPGPGEAAR